MKIRLPHVMSIVAVGLLVTLLLGVLAISIQAIRVDSARSELTSRGIECHTAVPSTWLDRIPTSEYVTQHLWGVTSVNCDPWSGASARLTDDVWLASLPLLERMPRVDRIYILDAPITRRTLESFTQLPDLTHLSLSGCDITDDDVKSLAALENLRWLDLTNTQISGVGLVWLSSLPNLKSLSVDGAPITPDGIDAMGTLTQLKSVSMSNVGLAESEIMRLETHLPGVMISDD